MTGPAFSDEFLARYRLAQLLGEGGMGTVWRAEQPALSRWVAIKVLRSMEAKDRERFRREAGWMAGLEHPHVVRVLDAGEDAGLPFLVMELVEGPTLGARLAEGPLTHDEARELAAQLAEALHAAHERGLVHRDVKPENVFLATPRHAKLADFGIARAVAAGQTLTAPNTVLGTPAYMSPDQVLGHRLTPASDQYSLGIVLYEMLCGRRPFEGDLPAAVAYARVQDDPPSPTRFRAGIPSALEAVAMRMLAREPSARFESCAAAAAALRGQTSRAALLASARSSGRITVASSSGGIAVPKASGRTAVPSASSASRASQAPTRALSQSPTRALSQLDDAPSHSPRSALALGLAIGLLGLAAFATVRSLRTARPPTPPASPSPAASPPGLVFDSTSEASRGLTSLACVPERSAALVAFERDPRVPVRIELRRRDGPVDAREDVPAGTAWVRTRLTGLRENTPYGLDVLSPNGPLVRAWPARTLDSEYTKFIDRVRKAPAAAIYENVALYLRQNPWATDELAQLLEQRVPMNEPFAWISLISLARETHGHTLLARMRPHVFDSNVEAPQWHHLGAAGRIGEPEAASDALKMIGRGQRATFPRDWFRALRHAPDRAAFEKLLAVAWSVNDFESRELAGAMRAVDAEWARAHFEAWIDRGDASLPWKLRGALRGLADTDERGAARVRAALLDTKTPGLRELAATILAETAGTQDCAALADAARRGPLSPQLAWAIARAQIAGAEPLVAAALAAPARAPSSRDAIDRAQVALALGAMRGASGLAALRRALLDPAPGVAAAACWALADRADAASGAAMLAVAADSRDDEGLAILAAGRLGVEGVVPLGKRLLKDLPSTGSGRDRVRRGSIVWALALGGEQVQPVDQPDAFVKDCARIARAVAKRREPPPRFLPFRMPFLLDRTMKVGEWTHVRVGGAQYPDDPAERARIVDLGALAPGTVAWIGTRCEDVNSAGRLLAAQPGRLVWSARVASAVETVPPPTWSGLLWISELPR